MHELAVAPGFPTATHTAHADALPYAPPKKPDSFEGARKKALVLLGVSFLLFSLTAGAIVIADSASPGFIGFPLAVLFAGIGSVRAFQALARGLHAIPAVPAKSTIVALLALCGNLAMMAVGALAALASTMSFSRGRQLRKRGRILLAPVVETDSGWTRARATPVALTETMPLELRTALAAQWRENGRTEHASVAAFARLTLDLLALGAPPELVAKGNRDALDEIRHTELCFSLATALDGRTENPGPFPEAARARTLPKHRALALAVLAVDSMVDGALHEGVSARIVARLARTCDQPAIKSVLKEIAADEGRHAAHGWDVVRFCLAEGGEPIAQALNGAVRALPSKMRSTFSPGARDGAWERYGIPGEALETEEFAKARADLRVRVNTLLAERERRAA